MTDALDAVGMTAVGVARVRAIESAVPDGLISDPLAPLFVPDWDAPRDAGPDGPRVRNDDDARAMLRMYLWIVARTVFLDRLCEHAADEGISQFVLLGVGLDARPFRLGDTTLRWFELDRPQVIEYRQRTIATSEVEPRGHRTTVVADLTEDWPTVLRDSGFDPHAPTVWLAEGLLVYLGAQVVAEVLTAVTALSAPGSRIGATVRGGGGMSADPSGPFAEVRALWQDTGDVVGRLQELGWSTDLTSAVDVLIEAGRVPSTTAPSPPTLLAGRR
ncbi:SAM-dependent methyltransferase [Williamsia sterculiae]|uniref:S-adenosyl-L-methionine-dependent methyltransferase n=1 Tax=Williamsia sterculiae TaxID=1344003 RepID=A0A1N7EYJ7_9NOCA|nr:SAM-dependent methyltransferase [Williamsia sterculiae]SIR93134.1 methyltransferase, TIGR00027 family [Williamsia sterculiae]